MFDQYIIRERICDIKRLCLSNRAVHTEVIHSMSTDAFILILQRFKTTD